MLESDQAHLATIRLVVALRHQLCAEAFTALLQSHADFRVLCTTTSTKAAADVCRHRHPDVALVDGRLVDQAHGGSLTSLVQQLGGIPILVLDEQLDYGRLTALMNLPRSGYYTRAAPFPELADGIRRLLRGENAFDSTIAGRVHQTPHGWQFHHGPESNQLTPREIEVWRLIAQGHSVKRCAELLQLAPSTVDNHKSHLMKKLGIHKSLDLTLLAVRNGLVSV